MIHHLFCVLTNLYPCFALRVGQACIFFIYHKLLRCIKNLSFDRLHASCLGQPCLNEGLHHKLDLETDREFLSCNHLLMILILHGLTHKLEQNNLLSSTKETHLYFLLFLSYQVHLLISKLFIRCQNRVHIIIFMESNLKFNTWFSRIIHWKFIRE